MTVSCITSRFPGRLSGPAQDLRHRCAHARSPCSMWLHFLIPGWNESAKTIITGVRKQAPSLTNCITVTKS